MGTSSSSPGPSGTRNPLLPPWAPETPASFPPANPKVPQSPNPDSENPESPNSAPIPNQQLNIPTPSVSWRSPKVALGNYIEGKRGSSLGKVANGYVKASGGARGATVSSRAGRQATGALASFISDGIKNGFVEAARKRGIPNITSLNVQDAIATLIEIIAPVGAMVEGSITRKAQLETLSDIFEKMEIESKGINALDQLTETDMEFVLRTSIANYINERFQQELINRIEGNKIIPSEANKICNEIKEYIFNVVKLDLHNTSPLRIDWEGSQGKEMIESMYLKAYALLGDEE